MRLAVPLSLVGLALSTLTLVSRADPDPEPARPKVTETRVQHHHHQLAARVPPLNQLQPRRNVTASLTSSNIAQPLAIQVRQKPRRRKLRRQKLQQQQQRAQQAQRHDQSRDQSQLDQTLDQAQEQYPEEALNRDQPLAGLVADDGEFDDDDLPAPTTPASGLLASPANELATTATTIATVASTSAQASEDRELLCLFRVYMDSFVSIGRVDMNDRLVFLVPLIIIYWHHRHPHAPLPYREIDNLLRDIGPDAQLHRLVLQEVVKRVAGTDNECARAGRESANIGGGSNGLLSRQQAKQAKAVEAMRILREWLDEEERLEEQTARQSGAREIRHWFRDLVGGFSGAGGGASSRRRGSGSRSSGASSAPAAATATATATTQQQQQSPARVATPSALPRDASEQTTTAASTTTTTEFYGLPHFENRTREYREDQAAAATTLSPPIWAAHTNMTLLNELNQLHQPNATTTSVGSVARASGGSEQATPPTHYGEFFDLVTSIIEEINVLNNSTAAIMAIPTTLPTNV